jgi:2-C-methyl-D-erythritol 4-phosphate cytidylyltransferase
MNTQYVIIVAGGSGSRMKSDMPKQFIKLAGMPILMRSITKFFEYNAEIKIIVVLPKDQQLFWKELCSENYFSIHHEVVEGGQTRFQSVKNGLSLIQGEGLVAIHDGVRPLVSLETIGRCFKLASVGGNAIPCIRVYESVRYVNDETSKVIDRSHIRLIQTPQVFSCSLIKEAYLQLPDIDFTDDASVLERFGYKVQLTEGNRENIKITDPFDLQMAEQFFN